MVFDAVSTKRELSQLEVRLQALEAEDASDDEIMDVLAEINELQDVLRNYETFPALLETVEANVLAQSYGESPPSLSECAEGLWRIRGCVAPLLCAALISAAHSPPGFNIDEGATDNRRGGQPDLYKGFVRRSDDVPLAEFLWKSLQGMVPAKLEATLAPPAEAPLRTQLWPQFQWMSAWNPKGIDARIVYERCCEQKSCENSFRLDEHDVDDRGEGWRALVTLIINLGSVDDSTGDASIQFAGGLDASSASSEHHHPPAESNAAELTLAPGDAVLLCFGKPNLAYMIKPAGSKPIIVAHSKIMYIPYCEANAGQSVPV